MFLRKNKCNNLIYLSRFHILPKYGIKNSSKNVFALLNYNKIHELNLTLLISNNVLKSKKKSYSEFKLQLISGERKPKKCINYGLLLIFKYKGK